MQENSDERTKMKEIAERAKRWVAAMPFWKQRILEQSNSPTVKVPRKPVVNK